MRYASLSEYWATLRSMGVTIGEARVDDEDAFLRELADAVAEWTAADGSLAIPARTWVATGTG
jgi:hypothetical protein